MTRRCSGLALLAGLAVCAGCVTVVTGDGERLRAGDAAFAEYVETVFRMQNDVASALAFALDDADVDSARHQQLEAVELAVLEACQDLNALAAARQRDERSGGLRGLAAARAAPTCEAAASEAASLLGD